jgi:WD40 repeat protein
LAPSLTPLDTSLIRTLQGHTAVVTAVGLSSDGARAVSGSGDETLRVWELKEGKEVLTLTIDANVTACTVGPDSRIIVVGDSFGRVHFLRLEGVD